MDAIRALGSHPRATPALLRLLADPMEDVRYAAIDALASLRAEGDPLYYPQDDHWNEAGHKAGALRAAEMLAPLLAAVKDRSLDSRRLM